MTIPASLIPAILGQDKFTTEDEALLRIWRRVAPGNFRLASIKSGDTRHSGYNIMVANVTKVLENHAGSSALVPSIEKVIKEEANLDAAITKVMEIIRAKHPRGSQISASVKSCLNIYAGQTLQDATLDRATRAMGTSVSESEVWRGTQYDGGKWCVGGFADGVCPDGSILECKVRGGTQLLPRAQIGDLSQAMAYAAGTGATARLIERCAGSLRITKVDDAEWWNRNAVPRLRRFVHRLHGAIRTETIPPPSSAGPIPPPKTTVEYQGHVSVRPPVRKAGEEAAAN